MALARYIFPLGDFPNNKVAPDLLQQEIRESEITVSLDHIDSDEIQCDIWFKDFLDSDSSALLTVIVSEHTGEHIQTNKVPVVLSEEFRDSGGRLRVHQTSRKEGLAIHWTSEGDDRSDPTIFGKGTDLSYVHNIGDATSASVYVDFNSLLNESWIHEVVLTWKGCFLDYVTVDIVPDVVQVIDSTASSFTTYGPVIIPAVPGTGNIDLAQDVLAYAGGLVSRDSPSDPTIEPSPAFWDADWNNETGRFENLRANPTGEGQYNMFHTEIVLNRTFNEVQLLGDGFQIFNSSDTDQITHGLRLKCIFETRLPDHDWAISGILVMHRKHVQIKPEDCKLCIE